MPFSGDWVRLLTAEGTFILLKMQSIFSRNVGIHLAEETAW